MRAIDPARFLGMKSDGAGECIYACAHNIGKHNVISTINFTNNGIEVKCVEPRHHETWRVSMGLAHTAAILFKLTHNDIETAATVWDFLAKSPKLDEDLDRLVIDTRHIIHFPTQVSSEAINAYIVYEAEKVNEACPSEIWNVLFLSEMKAPFDLEIAIRKHPLHSYPYICRVESKDLKDLFIECCIGRKEEEDERSTTSLNLYNGKYTICTHDVKSIFKRLLDELLYYEEWDKFVIKRIELEKIKTFAAKNIGTKQNQLIARTYNDDEIASWLRSTVAEATKTVVIPSEEENTSNTTAMVAQDVVVPTAPALMVVPEETTTNIVDACGVVADAVDTQNSSLEILDKTAVDDSQNSVYVRALMSDEVDPMTMMDIAITAIHASSTSLIVQEALSDNNNPSDTDAENIDAYNMDNDPDPDLDVPKDVFEGIDRDNDDGSGCGMFSGYDVLLQALSRHDVNARTKEETDAVLTMLNSWSCFRKHIADGSSSAAAAAAAATSSSNRTMQGDSKTASYRHHLPVEDINAIAAACRSTVQVILSSDPALTAPVVSTGESVRDAFIILKGHLLVTATITTNSHSTSSDVVGVDVGMGHAEYKRSSEGHIGMMTNPDDEDEMGQRASPQDHHASSVASLNTVSTSHVKNVSIEKVIDSVGNAEAKLTTVTKTETLLCGPGTFLGSQLFSGMSTWGVEIKAVDFATIHAALAMQKQQQEQLQQQQQLGSVIGVSTGTHSSPQNATSATSMQPDNHNNDNNNRSNNEKFVSAPSVVLCRIPAEVLLHRKGYTNANVRAHMDLFCKYIRQKGTSIDGIAASNENGAAVSTTTAINDERRGSSSSLFSSANSESGLPPFQLITLADLAWIRVVPRNQAVFRSGEPRRFIHAIVQGECTLQRTCPRTQSQTQRRDHLKQALNRRLRDAGIRSDSLVVPMVDEEGIEYTVHAIDEIDMDPMETPDGTVTVDFGSPLLSGDFCGMDGETMKLIGLKEKALQKDPEYLRALYHRQMWLRKAGPGANAAINAASATIGTKPRRRRAIEQELLRPVYGLLNDHQPTALFGTHQHTLLAKTQSLILTLPLLDLAGHDETLFYTLLHVIAKAYPKIEHPDQQRDDDWILFHDQQRIWSLEKRLSLQDHFHGKSCRGLGLVGLNDATCAIHGSNLPSPRGYLIVNSHHQPHQPHQPHRSLYRPHHHRKKKENDHDISAIDKEQLGEEGVEIPLLVTMAPVEEGNVGRGREEENMAVSSYSVEHNTQEERGGDERGKGGVDCDGEEEKKVPPPLLQSPLPQDEAEKSGHLSSTMQHTGKISRRSPLKKKRIPMFSKGQDAADKTGTDTTNSRECDDQHDNNPYNLRAGYLITQLIERVNHGEQLDIHNNNNNNNNHHHHQKR